MILGRDSKPKFREVEVDASPWFGDGATLRVRELNGWENGELMSRMFDDEGEIVRGSENDFWLVATCAVDESGNQIFDPDSTTDLAALGEWPSPLIRAAAQEICIISGMADGEDPVEQAGND